jgi:hypothetical protein
MNSSHEHAEYRPSPLYQVREFVTRVWEHPLLDEQTRRHRYEAKGKLSNVLNDLGFTNDDFIAVPVGSLLWSVDEQSDYDYQLLFSNLETKERYRKLHLDTFLEQRNIQVIGNPTYANTEEKIILSDSHFADLLLTPDEYLSGNIQLAGKLRQSILGLYSEADYLYYWDRVVVPLFDGGYRYWELSTDKVIEKPVKESRFTRFNIALAKRSQQSRVPSRYHGAFRYARDKLKLPSLKTYTEAMRESNGSLHIHPQFIAQGIR